MRAGSHQLAASSGAGPRQLPDSGTITYRGKTYAVTSFPAPGEAGVRIYLLVPATSAHARWARPRAPTPPAAH